MKTDMLTVGLELGDRRHPAFVLNETGDIVAKEALANTREVLAACREKQKNLLPCSR